jgi:hypothetical protein
MACHLLTVESVQSRGTGLRIMPPVRMRGLIERAPGMAMPMPGDPVELRLPGGQTRHATVASFGVESWLRDGELVTTADPADPACTLSLAGDIGAADLPAGTEVWIR